MYNYLLKCRVVICNCSVQLSSIQAVFVNLTRPILHVLSLTLVCECTNSFIVGIVLCLVYA